MSGPPPPPSPPPAQPYRVIGYPNYFLGSLAYGDPITVVTSEGPDLIGSLMDLTTFGITVWADAQLLHIRWERIRRLQWSQPE